MLFRLQTLFTGRKRGASLCERLAGRGERGGIGIPGIHVFSDLVRIDHPWDIVRHAKQTGTKLTTNEL